MRILQRLPPSLKVFALTSSPQRVPILRAAGTIPLLGNLDDPGSLHRLAGLATWVLHLAPPPGHGARDTRTQHLLQTLARKPTIQRLVYMSTTGVYGNTGGAFFDETRRPQPQTARAIRRVDAEQQVKQFGLIHDVAVSILRVPGIYAFDREGGDPRDRVRKGAPLLKPEHDVYTNHIHADDLARICIAALTRAKPQRIYHACDDAQTLMGDHFDAIYDECQIPRAPRLSREELQQKVSPMQWSFMNESRRLNNQRMKRELRVQLRWPHTLKALQALSLR